MRRAVNVLVADDHRLFRAGLLAILGSDERIRVVGEASDGGEAVRKAERLNPDVILMDIRMPGWDGVEATRRIREKGLDVGVLVLTVSDREDELLAAIEAGANGYLLKDVEPEELVQSILHVSKGEGVVCPPMATILLDEIRGGPRRKTEDLEEREPVLTNRERDVVRLLAHGGSNKRIGSALFISEETVKTHMRSIMRKLRLKNRYEAAIYAFRSGLVDIDELEVPGLSPQKPQRCGPLE